MDNVYDGVVGYLTTVGLRCIGVLVHLRTINNLTHDFSSSSPFP